MNFVQEEENDLKVIFNRFRKRDFSGNTGLAVKNSIYQLSTDLLTKIGSLFFIIILARLLMPELFGLYNLAFATILLFASISNLGIGPVLIKYVSRELSKGNKKRAEAYIVYLGKIKIFFIGFSVLLLLILSKFLSETYYQKPIFLALLAGLLYIIFLPTIVFLQSILQATNYFKGIFYKEMILQLFKIILVPLAVLIALKYSFSNQVILFLIILLLSLSYLFAALFLWIVAMKKTKLDLRKTKSFSKSKKKEIKYFLFPLSVMAVSGIFFSYIDRIMLGRFVLVEFIGYYSVALGLIGSLVPVVAFSSVVLLPIFSRLKGKKLKKVLKKARNITFLFSFFLTLIIFIFSSQIIQIIYGKEYILAAGLLRLFSLLLLFLPVAGLYQSYFISKGKSKKLAILLIISTIVNIFLNYFLITTLLPYGDLAAVYGAGIATLVSQLFYMTGLMIAGKN